MSSVRQEWNIWPPATFLWEMGPGLPRSLLAFARSQEITDIIRTSTQKPQERWELRVSQNPQREEVDTSTPRLGANSHRNISWELWCRANGILSQILQTCKIQNLKPMSTYTNSSHLFPEVPQAVFQRPLQQHQRTGVSRVFFFLEHDWVWAHTSNSPNKFIKFWLQTLSSTPNTWNKKSVENESGKG